MSEYKVGQYDVTEIQEKIFEIFLEFDRICKKHNIRYTLEGGTLLGAVLHKGFIPWDDDMDIIMLRSEYDKFCRVVDEDIREPFVFYSMEKSEQYPFLFGKIFNKNTIYKSPNTAHLDIPQGVFLDIFIEDNIKLRTKKLHSRIVSAIGTVRYIKLGVVGFSIKHIFYAPLFLFSITKLNVLADKAMRKYNEVDTGYVYPLCQSISSKPPLPKRMFTDFEKGIFNNFEVDIPTCHMWYLHKHYETPMELPPESSRHPTHGVVEIKL
ncbi:MAG: LicD family protein [Ruminococcus sp.]|nr:LicD family protein [Ruminococcus sp.]